MKKSELLELANNCSCEKTKASLLAVANAKKKDDDDDDDTENEGENARFDLKPGSQVASSGSTQAGDKGTKDEYEISGNRFTKEEKDLLRKSPTFRRVIANALETEKREKTGIINKILDRNGITDNARRRQIGQQWLGRPVETLREQLEFTPDLQSVQNSLFHIGSPTENVGGEADFTGAAGGPSGLANIGGNPVANEKAEPLKIPTLNFKEISEENARGGKKVRAS